MSQEEHAATGTVDAGLSGVGAAARLERYRPKITYAILEQRSSTGGTGDLFRYPDVRSDTDMCTFSYPFRRWISEGSMD